MLRNLGIRSKLLAVLAVPMLVLLIGASVVSLQAISTAKDARQVRAIADGARSFSALVAALQAERRVSEAKLQGDDTLGDQLPAIRQQSNSAAATTDALTSRIGLAQLSPEAAKALATNLQARTRLTTVRTQVDKGTISPAAVGAAFDAAILEEIQIPGRIAQSLQDRTLAVQLRSYSELELAEELATQERDLGRQVIADPTNAAAFTAVVARQADALQNYEYDATLTQRSQMTRMMDQSDSKAFTSAEASLLDVAQGKPTSVQDQSWVSLANSHVDVLQGLAAQAASTAAASAEQSASAATNRAWQALGLALLVLLLPLLLALVVARAIIRPLRDLTDAAGQVRDELPRLVETMATPGEAPDTELIRIPVTTHDEVGRLAVAFNDVNQTTMKIAREQAALRGSIAEMFVNVARRNHVLLSRQLSFIDQLERTEENPDTLDDLFKLDHLATRMRRNAESLIVLAGIDSGRRVRQAMPLSDVVRTAISEIEKYERVDMALRADPPVVGHVALTTAHLLAELLENATQFSNPDTRVFVVTSYSRRGVRVKITDAGLGMTYDEITDANQRIANPPVTDVVGSSRLGFFVVGRLARKLDARVTLRAARDRGTVVVIDLPAALFVPGTVAEVTGIDDDDEQSAAIDGTEGSPARPAEPTGAPSAVPAPVVAPTGLPTRSASPHDPRPTSSEPPAPTVPKKATPFPYDFGGSADAPAAQPAVAAQTSVGLPQRAAKPDSTPVSASSLAAPSGSTPDAAPSLPQRGTITGLPRRGSSTGAAPVQDLAGATPSPAVALPSVAGAEPAPVNGSDDSASADESARPGRRPGLFSGFRSRHNTPVTPDPLLTPLPELPPTDRSSDDAGPASEAADVTVGEPSGGLPIASESDVVTADDVAAVADSPVEPTVQLAADAEVDAEPEVEPESEVEPEPTAAVEPATELVADAESPVAEPVLVDSLAVEPVVDAASEHATEHATEQARIDESTALVEQDSLVTEDADYAPDVTPAGSRRAFFPLQRRGPQPAEPAELAGPAAVAEPVTPAEPVVPVADLAPDLATDVGPEPVGEPAIEMAGADVPSTELETETAEVETAEVETAEVETAEVETAEVETAEVETAEVETAEVETAELTVAESVDAGGAIEAIAPDVSAAVADEAAPPVAEAAHEVGGAVQRAGVFHAFGRRGNGKHRGRHYKTDDVVALPVASPPSVDAEPVTDQASVSEPVVEPSIELAPEPVAPALFAAVEPVATESEPEPEPSAPALFAPVPTEPSIELAPEPEPSAPALFAPVGPEPEVAPEPEVVPEPEVGPDVVTDPVADVVADAGPAERAPEPEPQPATPPAATTFTAFATEQTVDEATEPEPEPEPVVAPAAVGVLDILPGRPSGRGRRLPRFGSRAVKAPAPLPTRQVGPPAYTQAPSAPPVIPTPVVPEQQATPFPVAPAARVDQPAFVAAPDEGSRPGTEVPAPLPAGHFGTPVTAAEDQPSSSLFGAPPVASRSASPAAPAEPSVPGMTPGMDFETFQLRQRSAIASEALSELSALSGYRPQAVENRGQDSMPRRTPQATPGLEATPEATTPVPHRERSATDVRSMLSGFRAGVERGRAAPESDS